MKKLLTCFLILLSFHAFSQTFINEKWVAYKGTPLEIEWSESTLDGSKNLIVVGNTLTNSQTTDVLITKYNKQGVLLWEKQYNHTSNHNDYGIAVTTDPQGNIFIAGTSYLPSSDSYIYIILKYNPNGTLIWNNSYDDPSIGSNIPSDIIVDNWGTVYVTGGVEDPTSIIDFCTVKYTPNGTFSWVKKYDYNNLYDSPVSMTFDSNGDIIISGASAESTINWKYATLKYNPSGILLSAKRTNGTAGLDEPKAITMDNNGNIFVTGKSNSGGTHYNIKTIKLDNDFDIEWEIEYDGFELDDCGNAIGVDSENNIYIAGYSNKPNGSQDLILLKYDQTGTLIWDKRRMGASTDITVEATHLKIDDADNVIISGVIENSNNKDILISQYNNQGKLNWEKIYNGTGDGNDFPSEINIDDEQNVLVTGVAFDGTKNTYVNIKYERFYKNHPIVDLNAEPHHRGSELIIKFKPEYINTSFVDNLKTRFGDPSDALPSEVIDEISSLVSLEETKVIKIFPNLTTNHTTSTTRLGETIPIPKFWSTYLLTFHFETDLEQTIVDLNNLSDYIEYAEYNHIIQQHSLPNDPLFNDGLQGGLHPTPDFPNADINMNPAWDIQTGQDYVKIGIFDSPAFWSHEDFGDGTFSGSQFEGGFDYISSSPIESTDDSENNHGTHVSGIIGAKRDNNIGTAGIAGGGFDDNGIFSEGCALYSMGIYDNNGDTDASYAILSIQEGAMDANVNPPGYGLHVQNHSWGTPFSNNTLSHTIKFANRNQCILVASRGNDGDDNLNFPACYDDDWVVNVGGSGTNGEYDNGVNGNFWGTSNGLAFDGSNFGGNVDIIAPSVPELVTTPINPDFPRERLLGGVNIFPVPIGPQGNYQVFNGTSAAAPHVTGLIGLMLSEHNIENGQTNNLAPEDVEFIIQEYADDVFTVDYPQGYDDFNGWGKINAGETLARVEGPVWQVKHNSQPDNVITTYSPSQTIVVPFNEYPIPGGVYVAERVQVIHSYLEVLPSTTVIVDAWGRPSSVVGLSASNPISHLMWQDLNFNIIGNVVDVTAITNTWHITANASGQSLDYWLPAPPAELKTAYSLHCFRSDLTNINNYESDFIFKIFPNPTNDKFTIEHNLEDLEMLKVFDITGKLILTQLVNDNKPIFVNVSHLSSGIFICHLVTKNEVFSQKVVKQ